MSRGRKPIPQTGCVYRPFITRTDKAGKKTKSRGRFYWARYVDEKGQRVQIALKNTNGQGITDKGVAQSVLRDRVRHAERAAAGLIDPYVESAKVPFGTVITRYSEHLRAKAVTDLHLTKSLARIEWIATQAGITRLGDFTAERVVSALDALALGTATPETRNPGKLGEGRSPKTLNEYRAAAFGLGAWATKIARILAHNPIDAVPVRPKRGDIRKKRRALTPEEATRLLANSKSRSIWYEVALYTGLRVSEMQQLQWGDLQLDSDTPNIELRAETTKSRRQDSVPIRKGLASKLALLRPPKAKATDPVFRSTPTRETFRRDCERAGIDLRPDQRGRTLDRHALRTTFVTWLSVAGVAPRLAQKLARHSDLRLTMTVYTDAALLAGKEAVEALPLLAPEPAQDAPQTPSATLEPVALSVALEFVSEGLKPSQSGTEAEDASDVTTREFSGFDTACRGSSRRLDGGGGGNRTPVRKQSTKTSTRLVLDLISFGGAPQDGLPTNQPSTVSGRRQKA